MEPRRLPQHILLQFSETLFHEAGESSVAADGSLFFLVIRLSSSIITSDATLAIVPIVPMTPKNKVICITPFEIISRRGYTHASIPLLRDVRQPSF